jgi:hypothetical protein
VLKLKVVHQEFAKVFGITVTDSETVRKKSGSLESEMANSDKMMDYIIEKHFS